MTMHTPETPPLTEEALVEWLKTQPPDQEYIWSDPVKCLVGKYLDAHGSQWGDVQYSELPNYHEIAGKWPWTMGAALARAEQLKALPPPSAEPLAAEPLTASPLRQEVIDFAERNGALLPAPTR